MIICFDFRDPIFKSKDPNWVPKTPLKKLAYTYQFVPLEHRWETCGPWAKSNPHEHLIWPASEFSLPKLGYNIMSKQSSIISRYLGSKSREVTHPHSWIKVEF